MEELRMSELKLAISNIAWDKADDEAVYAAMQQNLSLIHISEPTRPY